MSRSSLKSKNKLVTPELTIHLTQFRYSKFSSTSNPTSTSFWMSWPPFPLEIRSSIDPRRTPTQSFLITIRSRTMPLLGLVPKIGQIRTRLEFLPLLICLQTRTAIKATIAAPPTPTSTPITIFLELSVRPPDEDCVWRFIVVGMRVSEVLVMGMVVATPLIVVTTSVVNVRMEREKEVDRVGETEGSVEMEVGVEADEEVPAGVDEVVGELEFVVGGMDAEVVGRRIGEVLNVEAVMDELSANCCLRSTSLLACISTGS